MVADDVDDGDTHAARVRLRRRIDLRLDDDDERRGWSGFRVVGQLADAARDQHANVGFAVEVRRGHRVGDVRRQGVVRERDVEGDHRRRPAQPPDVAVVEEHAPVVGPQRLVDSLAVDEPVIVDRHHRLIGRGNLAIDVHRSAHQLNPTS